MAERLFTREEMDQLVVRPHEGLMAAAKAGDKDKAKLWLKCLYKVYHYGFASRVMWDKVLMDTIYDKLGPDGVYDVMRRRDWTFNEIAPLQIQQEDWDEASRYIDSDDLVSLQKWVDRELRNYKLSHDLRCEWETKMMTFIHDNISPEAAYDALHKIIYDRYAMRVDNIAHHNFDMKLRVIYCIWGNHHHYGKISMDEDDEKITIKMEPCNSGMKMYHKGLYGAPYNCTMCKACPGTFSVDHFPIYCIHSPIQEFAAIDRVGWPTAINTPWDECDEPGYQFAEHTCHYQLYKDPKYIPDRVWEMLGKKRPDTYKFPGYEGFDWTPIPGSEIDDDYMAGPLELFGFKD